MPRPITLLLSLCDCLGHAFPHCASHAPAVYEKAFAKLKTGTATDMPDITQTAWGDGVAATAQLNDGTRRY